MFLVDDHEIVRRALIELFEADPELTVIGQASGVAEAIARIREATPDVAVLDVRLPDGNGIELCRALRAEFDDLHCLILTGFSDEHAMLDAVAAGASGYVVKNIDVTELIDAIKQVGAGHSLFGPRAADALRARLHHSAEPTGVQTGLTDQEHRLLDLLGQGLTNREIAARMFLAEKTVQHYVSRLLAKLGVERRVTSTQEGQYS
ncbi:response regulator [Nocardia asteroides]